MKDGKTIFAYPGTFDPIHLGHVDVIEKGMKNARNNTFIIAVAAAPGNKKHWFNLEERVEMIEKAVAEIEKRRPDLAGIAKVVPFEGSLVRFAHENDVDTIVRGSRPVDHIDEEKFRDQNAAVSKAMKLPILEYSSTDANPELKGHSSTLVKEFAKVEPDISMETLVPDFVEKAIKDRIAELKAEETVKARTRR